MKIVVTGSSGLIGSALSNLIQTQPGLELIPVIGLEGKLNDKSFVLPFGDVIVHLSENSIASKVDESSKELNLKKLKKIIERNYPKIIYASSGIVYGDQAESPCSENYPATSTSSYALSKLQSESLVLSQQGIVLRLGNVYGYLSKEETIIGTILQQIKNGNETITLFNKTSIRDYIWVDDVAECILKAILNTNISGIFNVSSGVGTPVYRIVEILSVLARKNVRVVESFPIEKRSQLVLDNKKAKTQLNWLPKTSIDIGLKKIWEKIL